ncbi:MAG TPA: HupE/UreJ family protein [Thiobacillus sp.]|nr:HupE/UreJ family protein [Thiobacillus sp.]
MATPLAAVAHPGHGGVFAGFAHPFTGLDHFAAMFAVGLLAAQMAGRARWALPGGFVLAALAGALLGFGRVVLPGLESVIAASVAVLGMALIWRRGSVRPVGRDSPTCVTALLTVLVAAFGLFHGNAHALEASGSPVGFVAGFLTGTTLLHGLGLVVGARVQDLIVRAAGVALAALGGWLMLGTLA